MVQRSRRRRSSTRRRNTRRKQRSTRRKQRSTRRKQRSTRRKQRSTRRRRNTRRRRKIKSKSKSKKYDLRSSTGKRSREDAFGPNAGDEPPAFGVVWAAGPPEPVPGGRFAALMMAGISKKEDPLVPKIYTTMMEMNLATSDSKYEKQIVFKTVKHVYAYLIKFCILQRLHFRSIQNFTV